MSTKTYRARTQALGLVLGIGFGIGAGHLIFIISKLQLSFTCMRLIPLLPVINIYLQLFRKSCHGHRRSLVCSFAQHLAFVLPSLSLASGLQLCPGFFPMTFAVLIKQQIIIFSRSDRAQQGRALPVAWLLESAAGSL